MPLKTDDPGKTYYQTPRREWRPVNGFTKLDEMIAEQRQRVADNFAQRVNIELYFHNFMVLQGYEPGRDGMWFKGNEVVSREDALLMFEGQKDEN